MFKSGVNGFSSELRRQPNESCAPTAPSQLVRETVANIYSTITPGYTTPDHVLVGIHTTSLMFLLNLAINTYNQCALDKEENCKLSILALDDTSTEKGDHMLRVVCGSFPQSIDERNVLIHSSHSRILIADVSEHITRGEWSCAVMIFPKVIGHSIMNTIYKIVDELLKETMAMPTPQVYRALIFTCSPWMLHYDARCRRLASASMDFLQNELADFGNSLYCPNTTDKPYTVMIEVENTLLPTTTLSALEKIGVVFTTVPQTTRSRLVFDRLLDGDSCIGKIAPNASTEQAVSAWIPDKEFETKYCKDLRAAIVLLRASCCTPIIS